MNSFSSLLTLCLAGCLLASGMVLIPAYADDDVYGWRDTGAVLSVPQVRQKLDAAGYRNVEKIKRKRGNYEVRTAGRDGERVKLYMNAQTGALLGQYDSGKDRSESGSVFQMLTGDCNKRRCRDDMPSAPVTNPTKP